MLWGTREPQKHVWERISRRSVFHLRYKYDDLTNIQSLMVILQFILIRYWICNVVDSRLSSIANHYKLYVCNDWHLSVLQLFCWWHFGDACECMRVALFFLLSLIVLLCPLWYINCYDGWKVISLLKRTWRFHRSPHFSVPVSYTHLTLPTNREV